MVEEGGTEGWLGNLATRSRSLILGFEALGLAASGFAASGLTWGAGASMVCAAAPARAKATAAAAAEMRTRRGTGDLRRRSSLVRSCRIVIEEYSRRWRVAASKARADRSG